MCKLDFSVIFKLDPFLLFGILGSRTQVRIVVSFNSAMGKRKTIWDIFFRLVNVVRLDRKKTSCEKFPSTLLFVPSFSTNLPKLLEYTQLQ